MPSIDVGDAEIFYAEQGSGDPLVLVHGGFLDHNLWAFTVPLFAAHHRVLAVDAPGHGQSTGTFDKFADAHALVAHAVGLLEEAVEKLGIGPAHFAGQSSGGGFLLHLAARRPDLVRSLSLHEPANVALADPEFGTERDLQREAGRRFAAGDAEGGLTAFVASVGGDWEQMPEPAKAMFRQNAHLYVGARFFEDPTTALPLPGELDAIQCPVLFTKGSRSPRFFHVSIDRVAASIPSAEVATIVDAAHAAMLERPAEYAACVLDFLRRGAATAPVASHRR